MDENNKNLLGEAIDIEKWVEDSKSSFKPPICNKMMYGAGQLKVMFVGGPNSRKDYHIEEGEEFFYMLKGDMCLKIMEKGKPKDVHIREGEVFALPSRIPHSPQRKENTVGVVIERERALDEMDGLRYYCEDGFTPLFEKWFHCEDLVKDLPPVIKEYMASEQYKTGKPVPGTITENPPLKLDTITEVHQPFNLHDWIDKNKATILSSGMKEIFSEGEFKITAYGAGSFESENSGETWLWQLGGTSHVKVGEEVRTLKNGEVILIPANMKYSVEREANSVGLTVNMDPMAAKSK